MKILVQTRGTTAPLIKLCDFGFSKDKDDSQPKSTVGTALFFAPEVAISNDSEPYAVEPADTWACGVVLYMLLFGGHPFLQKVETSFSFFIIKLISNSREGKLTFPEGAEAAMPQAVALIRSILLYNPATRIKIPELMNHPWFLTNLPQNALTLNETLLSKRCSTVNDGWLVAPVEIGQSMLFDELQNQIRTRQQSRLTSKEMDK